MNKQHRLVEAASTYLGYTSRQQNNIFAISTGYTGGFQWDGSFVDRVLRDAGYGHVPSHANTTTALAFYMKNGQHRTTPKRGYIVFYAFSARGGTATFDPPHIGIVTDISRWKTDGSFKAIEAQVSSGTPKGPTEENGVYERTRYATDVLAFVNVPEFKNTKKRRDQDAISETVSSAHINRCLTATAAATANPSIRKKVEAVQIALAAHPAVRFRYADRGVFNLKSQSAFASFQRSIGLPAERCDGIPTDDQLDRLAQDTDYRFFR